MLLYETTSLKQRVKHGLDEILIMITGVEILVGFQYTAVFNRSFSEMPVFSQYLHLVGLALLLLSLAFIISPVPFHRITERGEDTERLCRYIRYVILIALMPFALSLGIGVYIVTQKIGGTGLALFTSVLGVLATLVFWYIIEYVRRHKDGRDAMNEYVPDPNEKADTSLADKVDHVLTEARVVLPGAQALLGFQFATVFVDGFDTLTQTSKYLHLLGLLLIALSTILLMTPAAYHRIVEHGEDTEHFHWLAGRFVLWAMAVLAFGITINFYIVVEKVTRSVSLAVGGALVALVLFCGFWFGYTLYRRQNIEGHVNS